MKPLFTLINNKPINHQYQNFFIIHQYLWINVNIQYLAGLTVS